MLRCQYQTLIGYLPRLYNLAMKTVGRIIILVCCAVTLALYVPLFVKSLQQLIAVGWADIWNGVNQAPFVQFIQCITMFILVIGGLFSVITGYRMWYIFGYAFGILAVSVATTIIQVLSGAELVLLDYIGMGFSYFVPISYIIGHFMLGKSY